MSGTMCAVVCCKNRLKITKCLAKDISYHTFPKDSEPEHLKTWILRTKRTDKFNPKSYHICSEYFDADDFERNLKAEMLNLTKTLASCSNSGTSTTDVTYIQNVTSSESCLNNTTEKDNVPIVDSISEDPAEWFGNKTRYLKKSVFYRKLLNGEQQLRKFLIYSRSKNAVFCIPCRLFGGSTKLATEGLMDWRNVIKIVKQHEVSKEHTNCQIVFLRRSNNIGRIDSDLCIQINNEIDYWKNVLKRVIAVIKKLGSRGLPFRGSVEKFGSQNNGNFMMCLELISEFDPFLSNHIVQHGNPGSGHTSYLSSTTCDEIITLITTQVTNVIIKEIKSAKYFSIVIDSTPDISHTDQLAYVIRYVRDDGFPVERFMCFLPNIGHKSETLETAVLSFLTKHDIDINNCRGQSYDNAANMSGIYSGLQARIVKKNPYAYYVPCAAHSLNLVGTCVAECVKEGLSFFNTIQHLYSFFSASTRRWDILKSSLTLGKKVVKRADGTRWSARHEACDSLYQNYDGIMKNLSLLEEDNFEKATTRCEAAGLRRQLDRFETVFMTVFWNTILERFNSTSKELQKSEEYEFDKVRTKKRKLQADETRENEVHMTGSDKLRIETYFTILDRVKSELEKRCAAYTNTFDKYDFLTNLILLSPEEITQKANKLQELYSDDLEKSFACECVHFRAYLQSINTNIDGVIELSIHLRGNNLDTVFPNVDNALRMLLCMAITNCSAERSFSTLKRVKNYLRASMEGDKLNSLSLLEIETELVNKMDFDAIIDDFATQKSRRKPMSTRH
ncbi:zinc finger MYM-type protein 1-like [Melanaphis sacchari]|uniref:zinc finger MYM-type protein 1-like n=1 Tax=Melanaphis sacchari TaxID=742174 RepID=UPI000DC14A2C|nr:zinc finger MYM-type protein 1-like [Melanaphis sacchari]